MEVGSANLENLDPMGKFLRELVNQNCGRGSFYTVDRHHCGAAPGKGVIPSNYQYPLMKVDDTNFCREFAQNNYS